MSCNFYWAAHLPQPLVMPTAVGTCAGTIRGSHWILEIKAVFLITFKSFEVFFSITPQLTHFSEDILSRNESGTILFYSKSLNHQLHFKLKWRWKKGFWIETFRSDVFFLLKMYALSWPSVVFQWLWILPTGEQLGVCGAGGDDRPSPGVLFKQDHRTATDQWVRTSVFLARMFLTLAELAVKHLIQSCSSGAKKFQCLCVL